MCLSAPLVAGTLLVSAASSLTEAMQQLAQQYEATHPGDRVVLNFGASGSLLQQAARGAPVDVLIAADTQTLDDATRQRLVADDGVRMVARNTLVVVVPMSSRQVPRNLAELANPGYARIALGAPGSVPAGRYARSALEASGHWPAVSSRVVGAANVRQVLDYVARAEVDAGFVYLTDAQAFADRVQVAFTVTTPQPVLYPAMLMRAAPQPEGGRRFLDWLRSAAAQQILQQHGFGAP